FRPDSTIPVPYVKNVRLRRDQWSSVGLRAWSISSIFLKSGAANVMSSLRALAEYSAFGYLKRAAFWRKTNSVGLEAPTICKGTSGIMARIVMKFGGTSVADLSRIHRVARHVKREVDA